MKTLFTNFERNTINLMLVLFFSIFVFPQNLFATGEEVRGDIDNWSSAPVWSMTAGLGSTFIYTSGQIADVNNAKAFKFFKDSEQWYGGTFSGFGTKITGLSVGGSNLNFNHIQNSFYTFKWDGTGNGYVFQWSQAPVTVSSVTSISGTVTTGQQTVTVTFSGNPDANERVYLRYTTDNWTTSAVIEGDPASSSIDIIIPAQPHGTTVKYYVFTSGASGLASGLASGEYDLATVNFDNNAGSNYSYTSEHTQAYYTPTIDGSPAEWRSSVTQIFSASAASGTRTLDITWDANYIYFLINSGFTASSSDRVMIGIDKNPGTGTDANGTASTFNGASFPENYRPDYIFRARGTGSNIWENDMATANGSNAWTYTGNIGNTTSSDMFSKAASNTTNLEIRIKRSAINGGTFTNLGFFVWFGNTSDNLYDSYPNAARTSNGELFYVLEFNSFGNATVPTNAKKISAQIDAAGFNITWGSLHNLQISTTAGNTVNCNALTNLSGNLLIDANAAFSMGTNAAALNITGNLTNNGSLSLSTNTGGDFNIAGNFANNGTFNANNRLVLFNGSVAQTITGSTNFNYLTINNSAGISITSGTQNVSKKLNLQNGNFTIGAGNTLSFSNEAEISRSLGSLNINTGTLTFGTDMLLRYTNELTTGDELPALSSNLKYLILDASTKTITLGKSIAVNFDLDIRAGTTLNDNGYIITVEGDVANAGTHSGTGKLVMFRSAKGVGPQAIIGGTFGNVEINNSSVDKVAIENTVNINGTLTLTNGHLLIATNYVLCLNENANIAGTFTNSNHIIIEGTGEMRKVLTSNLASNFTFPVGDATNYTPLILTSLTADAYTSAYFAVKVVAAKLPENTSSTDFLNRYWIVSGSGLTNPIYAFECLYNQATDITGTETNLKAGVYYSSVFSYLADVDDVNNKISVSNVNLFGSISAGEADVLMLESKQTGNWSDPSSWLRNEVPVSDVKIHIAHDITLDIPATVQAIEIDADKTFTANNILTVNDGGSIENSGTFVHSSNTVVFSGDATVIGTIKFFNIQLNGDLDIGTAASIDDGGTLELFANSTLINNVPTYLVGSNLKYYTGNTEGDPYYVNAEWKKSIDPEEKGVPYNVEIATGTYVQFPVDVFQQRLLRGTLKINGTFKLGGFLEAGQAGDLLVMGNFINNGTFIANTRRVYFNGTEMQDISGAGETHFTFATFQNALGVSLSNTSIFDDAILQTGVFRITALGTFKVADYYTNAVGSEMAGQFELHNGTTLTVDGTLTLLSSKPMTANLLQLGNSTINGANADAIQVQRWMQRWMFHYVSPPIAEATSDMFYENNFYRLNTSAGWEPHTGALTAGKGYASWNPDQQLFNFQGTLNNGNIDVPVALGSYTIGAPAVTWTNWNLIGNPYPSSIYAGDFLVLNTSDIEGTIYLWDDDGAGHNSGYASWNLTGGTWGWIHKPNGYLGSSQAFMIQAKAGGDGTVSFTNAMRDRFNGTFFKAETTENSKVLLQIIGEDLIYNSTLIGFHQMGTLGYDNLYDGNKIKSNPKIALYTMLNDKDLSIQAFPELTGEFSVPVGLDVATAQAYTFSIAESQNFAVSDDIILEDQQTNTFTNLQTDNYTFNISQNEVGQIRNRFILHFNKIITATNQIEANNKVNIYSVRNNVFVNNNTNECIKIQIYNILGHLIFTADAESGLNNYELNTEAGIYIVKTIGTQNVAKRVFIQQ